MAALIVACGCVGLIGAFLPTGESLWSARDDWQVYWVFACFLVAIALGVLAGFRPPLRRWHAIVAGEAFLIVVLKFRASFLDLITDGTYGQRMVAGAVIAGVIVSVIAALRAPKSLPE